MPERDDPSSFFLPPNSTKTIALSQKQETILYLRKLSSITNENDIITKNQWNETLIPLFEKWKDLIRKYPKLLIPLNNPSDDSPMASALFSQSCIIHNLVKNINLFFNEVDGFLNKGNTLSHQIQSLGKILINGEVPEKWFDIVEGPLVINEWLNEFVRKVDIIDTLSIDPKLIEKGIEFGALLRPTALLDALRQQTARKLGLSIIELNLSFGFGEPKSNSIYITDLSIQGAVFQGLKIAPMIKDGPVVTKCPNCYFIWEKNNLEEGIVKIPLYSNSNREKFIVSIPTPCQETKGQNSNIIYSFAGTAFLIGNN